MSNRALVATTILILFSAPAHRSEGAPPALTDLKRVALTGDAAPGTANREFLQFRAPNLNNRGQVAFGSTLNCCFPQGTIYSTGRGELELVAFQGSPAEEGGISTFSGFDVQLDDLGRTLIRGTMTHLPPEFVALWVGQENQKLTRIVASGQPVDPSDPSTTYRGFGFVHVGSGGVLAGSAVTITNGNTAPAGDVLFISDGTGPAQPILRAGDQLDFLPEGVLVGTYYYAAIDNPVINKQGQIGVRTATVDTRGLDVEPYGSHILLIEPDNTYTSVVSQGDPAPGLGADFSELSLPVISDQGVVGFGAFVGSSGHTGPTIWRRLPGEAPELIVRQRDPAPGMPGVIFDHLFVDVFAEIPLWINNRGDVAFLTSLVGEPIGNNFAESVWIGSPEGLRPVVVEGQEAPGTGGVFASMTSTIGDLVVDMAVNNNSQVAVHAQFESPSGQLRSGLFATDIGGNLRKIAAYGDWIEVAPGDVRQVFSIEFKGDLNYRRTTGFNDRGEVAFRVLFMDGTQGVFISSAVVIPEPSAALLLSACLSCVLLIHRRRRFCI